MATRGIDIQIAITLPPAGHIKPLTISQSIIHPLSISHTHIMLSSLPLCLLLLLHLTSTTHAAPLPQGDVTSNAPAGPPITDEAGLSSSLGDLVIPQEESSNTTATATKKERDTPPMDYSRLVDDIEDFRLPTNITAGSVVNAVK